MPVLALNEASALFSEVSFIGNESYTTRVRGEREAESLLPHADIATATRHVAAISERFIRWRPWG